MDDADISDTVIGPLVERAPGTASIDEDTLVREPIPLIVPVTAPPLRRPEHVASAPPESAVSAEPAPYRFAVNRGEPLPLDTPVLIGRRPRTPRIASTTAPRLVTVESPQREVSATHLELRQQGSSVIVTDMRSTNGTVVTIPGVQPVALRPGESIVAVPGALVDIGDGNLVEILPVQRIVPPGHGSFERRST